MANTEKNPNKRTKSQKDKFQTDRQITQQTSTRETHKYSGRAC